MAIAYDPNIVESSTTTGTGDYTVAGALAWSQTFASRCAVGTTFRYMARAVDASGNPNGAWEYGLGTYSAANTISRTVVIQSSNGDAAVSWGAGTKYLYLVSYIDAVLGQNVEGGIGNLADRIATISNFASPNAGGYFTGQYYDNSFQGTAASTLAGSANRWDMAPFYSSTTYTIDLIGCSVSTAVAGATFKCVIYDADSNGWPNARLLETSDISGATATYASAAVSFQFLSGKIYWVGVRHSSTCTLRTINVSSAVNLGLTSNTAANYATILRRTLTYATAATTPYVAVNGDRTANVTPPSIRWRIGSVP